ncbi:MAG: hypothetical protein JWM33_2629 [Caulobacteraceae bacterium]|nr:hypothetical protein [Caulobacteraceae bacterium]
MAAKIRIGTAGWSIASANAGLFPQAGTHLQRYAGRFDAAEINSSFYRPHRRSTYERWAEATPVDFRFSVKLPRSITHERRLVDCRELIDQFADEVGGLGDRLGVILVQLPPSLTFDATVAAGVFADLQARLETSLACEPRHISWFTPEAAALLAALRVARVAADPAIVAPGDQPGGWDGLAYWRWHGSPRIYYSAYDPERLQSLARQIAALPARPHWIIFDNTVASAAARDAAALQAMVRAS